MDDFYEQVVARRFVPLGLCIAGLLLIIISSIIWWTQVYENPYNVYWGMLANSLSTASVTKHVTELTSDNDLDQYISLNFGADNVAYGKTTLTDPQSSVTTESIGTMQSDYVRYTSISSSTSTNGKSPSFSTVLGKWAKANVQNAPSEDGSAPFFVQTMLGIAGGNLVPIANLPDASRQSLLQLLHQSVIFNTSFSNVGKSIVDGRPMYTYTVAVEPVAYVAFEKSFASTVGIKALEEVDPNDYQGDSPIAVKFVIDARSHRLAAIDYPGTRHTESYSSYGVPYKVTYPESTITDARLQQLLGDAQ